MHLIFIVDFQLIFLVFLLKNDLVMVKRFLGYSLLFIGVALTITILYRIFINPNLFLKSKTLLSGELGIGWTFGIFVFHFLIGCVIYLLTKKGWFLIKQT
ncbi:protein of unknown function [Tenacibaculum sp. 190524A02b]|uniref:Uncharacterized protein n=1 Tax=Tenacibaculum vairaonense TaxID=3137860 RepID=A0ABM9PIY6_9FLAO